ncbi:hypothetical protein QOZ80_2BG0184170 [Eleusine coracana subsp. coracana]|nr:hypothetical protein QOZ80_2BG0184170 [Eleusine coracana subsp. coracana]
MAEAAGEELAKLEAAHPGRFGPLKAELRRLVAEPGLDAAAAFPPLLDHCCFDPAMSSTPRDNATPSSSQSQAATPLLHLSCTQESSTSDRKRKPGGGDACERNDGKRRRRRSTTPRGAKDRADMAIERAERCLERIRAVKQSLLAAWTH